MKFTEAQLENAIIELLEQDGIPHLTGDQISRPSMDQVLIKEDLREFLTERYKEEDITPVEVNRIIMELERDGMHKAIFEQAGNVKKNESVK